MNCCEECIVYKIQNNILEKDVCVNCGNTSMGWRLGEFGTPYLNCSKCDYTIAVDLNTPCEEDYAFRKKYQVIIRPTDKIPNAVLLRSISKFLGMNILQARKIFVDGYKTEMEIDKLGVFINLLQENNINYEVVGYDNPRLKYQFYKECKYRYSKMKFCLKIDKKE